VKNLSVISVSLGGKGTDRGADVESHHASRVGNGFKSLNFLEMKKCFDPTELGSSVTVLDQIPASLVKKCQLLGSSINTGISRSSVNLRDAIANSGEVSLEKTLHFESISEASICKYGKRLAKLMWFFLVSLDSKNFPVMNRSLCGHANLLNERLLACLTQLKNSLDVVVSQVRKKRIRFSTFFYIH